MTWNAALLVFSLESVAEQLTTVEPKPKLLPEPGTQLTGTAPSTTSIAEVEKLAVAPVGLVASIVISAGKVSAGASGSWTLIIKLPFAVLLCASVAEHLTRVE